MTSAKAKACMFIGTCIACGEHSDDNRAAVTVSLYGDDEDLESCGESICVPCAHALSRQIGRQAVKAANRVDSGYVYRNDRWVKRGGT